GSQGLEQPVDEVLGLGSGDQHATIDGEVEVERMKAAATFDVRDRLAGEATTDQRPKARAVVLVEQPIMLKVELEASAAERPTQEMLRVNPSVLDAELRELLGRPAEQLAHGPA